MYYEKDVLSVEATVKDYTAVFTLHSGDKVKQEYKHYGPATSTSYGVLSGWHLVDDFDPVRMVLNGNGDFVVTDKIAFPKADIRTVDISFTERKVVVDSPFKK